MSSSDFHHFVTNRFSHIMYLFGLTKKELDFYEKHFLKSLNFYLKLRFFLL